MEFWRHMWVAASSATEAFSTTCTVHIEDCDGWWLSGCHGSVESTGGSSQRCPNCDPCNCGRFHFLSFCLITPNLHYFESILNIACTIRDKWSGNVCYQFLELIRRRKSHQSIHRCAYLVIFGGHSFLLQTRNIIQALFFKGEVGTVNYGILYITTSFHIDRSFHKCG